MRGVFFFFNLSERFFFEIMRCGLLGIFSPSYGLMSWHFTRAIRCFQRLRFVLLHTMQYLLHGISIHNQLTLPFFLKKKKKKIALHQIK